MFENFGGYASSAAQNNLMRRVYGWMFLALTLTASAAYWVAHTPSFYNIFFKNPSLVFVLFMVQLILVVALSTFVNRMSVMMAIALFVLYALSLGVTLSTIFAVFTQASIFATFMVTASMFGAMAIYGTVTNADLSAIGSFGFMALIGLIIGGVINMFLRSEGFQYVLSALGVFVFTILTAYDVQKIKQLAGRITNQTDLIKVSLLGALTLYLDFVNLFLYLLQFMGRRKD